MLTRERLTRWTAALRANPEQQHADRLANEDYTKFCCLGKLCEVEGVERTGAGTYANTIESFVLPVALSFDLGNNSAFFKFLNMPNLIHNTEVFFSAVQANDAGVPWPVIAEHFDKYYPCSDEQKEIK